jgi:hypothetical protein
VNTTPVVVTNTTAQPVPTVAQGTTAVTGTVAISGTPTVNVGNLASVQQVSGAVTSADVTTVVWEGSFTSLQFVSSDIDVSAYRQIRVAGFFYCAQSQQITVLTNASVGYVGLVPLTATVDNAFSQVIDLPGKAILISTNCALQDPSGYASHLVVWGRR